MEFSCCSFSYCIVLYDLREKNYRLTISIQLLIVLAFAPFGILSLFSILYFIGNSMNGVILDGEFMLEAMLGFYAVGYLFISSVLSSIYLFSRIDDLKDEAEGCEE